MSNFDKLPNRMTFLILESKKNVAQLYIEISEKEYVSIGSKIENWDRADDGFMYHDVLHLANMAILGWSPVSEGLLRVADGDAYESGWRAQVIEEVISVLSFDMISDIIENESELPEYIMHLIGIVTQKSSSKNIDMNLWFESIRKGVLIVEKIRENKGGFVDIDLKERSISFRLRDNS